MCPLFGGRSRRDILSSSNRYDVTTYLMNKPTNTWYLHILFLFWLLFIAESLSQSTLKNTYLKSQRIVIETKEIVLLDNHRKIRKLYESQLAYFDVTTAIKKKVYQILGVNSADEISNRNLWYKYNQEIDKYIQTRDLPHKKLLFLNITGKVVKEMELSNIKGDKISTRQVSKQFLGSDTLYSVEESLVRYAGVSKDTRVAVVVENFLENIVLEKREPVLPIEQPSSFAGTGKLQYYNRTGQLVWEKQFTTGWEIAEYNISNAGECVAVLQGSYVRPDDFYLQLVVFNRKGEEIFKFPVQKDTEYYILNNAPVPILMSPSGKYICLRISDGILFVDTQRKTSWKLAGKHPPELLTDEGMVYLPPVNFNDTNTTLFLPDYLGK